MNLQNFQEPQFNEKIIFKSAESTLAGLSHLCTESTFGSMYQATLVGLTCMNLIERLRDGPLSLVAITSVLSSLPTSSLVEFNPHNAQSNDAFALLKKVQDKISGFEINWEMEIDLQIPS